MNSEQIKSFIRSLLKIAGGILAARGLQDAAGWINAEDTVGLIMTIIGFVWSHYGHKDDKGGPATPASIGTAGAVLILCGGLLSGCTATQQQVTYNTIYSVEKSTTTAVDAYFGLVVSGKVPTNDVPRVSALFNQFQVSLLLASDAAQFNTNAMAPESLVVESKDLINMITTIQNGGHSK